MQHLKNILFFISIVFLILPSCKKYVGDYDANYIGEWHSDTLQNSAGIDVEVYFIINGNDSEIGWLCELNCSACACSALSSGKAVINRKHNKLIIGSGNGKQRIRVPIVTPPYQDANGNWLMVIDAGDLNLTMRKR